MDDPLTSGNGSRRADAGEAFLIRLGGPGIAPGSVPLRRLISVLESVQRLIDPREAEDGPPVAAGSVDDARNPLNLLGVQDGSAVYRVSALEPLAALRQLESFGDSLGAAADADWHPAGLSAVEHLSRVARRMGLGIELLRPAGGVIARIGPDTYHDIAEAAFIDAPTALRGVLQRVGGADRPRCSLRVASMRRLVYASVVGEKVAHRLSRHLYEELTVHGPARLLRRSGRLVRFTVERFDLPREGTLLDALDAVYAAGGSGWDGVLDPSVVLYGGDA